IEQIFDETSRLVDYYHVETAAMEKLFFNTNSKTAIDVAQARGVLLLALTKKRIHSSEFTPLHVKKAVTGYGRAEKEQVEAMVKMLLNLEKIPKPDDAADALAIAICCAHCIR
ncbi:MAG: crossover junction endodeoxyribonuclease RuvC, partial [Clostridia bacterium]|nr:crossover junction endodeoxyribonuclease RuvC [Clostridia bacterium]